jgi:hypothetical protein
MNHLKSKVLAPLAGSAGVAPLGGADRGGMGADGWSRLGDWADGAWIVLKVIVKVGEVVLNLLEMIFSIFGMFG